MTRPGVGALHLKDDSPLSAPQREKYQHRPAYFLTVGWPSHADDTTQSLNTGTGRQAGRQAGMQQHDAAIHGTAAFIVRQQCAQGGCYCYYIYIWQTKPPH